MRQDLIKVRAARRYKNGKKLLCRRRPLRRGTVSRPVLRSPKKPHSAKRATVKFEIRPPREIRRKYRKSKHAPRNKLKNYAYIPAEGGRARLKRYDTIYFRGGRRRDIPAMKYTAVHGVVTKKGASSSLNGLSGQRMRARSKYAAKAIYKKVN